LPGRDVLGEFGTALRVRSLVDWLRDRWQILLYFAACVYVYGLCWGAFSFGGIRLSP
jgi:hypothetical protein